MLKGEQAGGIACTCPMMSEDGAGQGPQGTGQGESSALWPLAWWLLPLFFTPGKGEDQHRKLASCLLVAKAFEGARRDTGAWLIRQETSVDKKVHV